MYVLAAVIAEVGWSIVMTILDVLQPMASLHRSVGTN
jgi:hypothetical protein